MYHVKVCARYELLNYVLIILTEKAKQEEKKTEWLIEKYSLDIPNSE